MSEMCASMVAFETHHPPDDFRLAHSRFFNLYGTSAARLGVHDPRHESLSASRSKLVQFSSLLLFNITYAYLANLELLWVDKRIVKKEWEPFMAMVKADWERILTNVSLGLVVVPLTSRSHCSCFVMKATIILNANVAFLAIPVILPSLAGGGGAGPAPSNSALSSHPSSIAQVASLISILLSAGSAIIALLLLGQYRQAAVKTADDVVRAMVNPQCIFSYFDSSRLTFFCNLLLSTVLSVYSELSTAYHMDC